MAPRQDTWKKSGMSGIAHLIEKAGGLLFVTACRVTITKSLAIQAGAGDIICPGCLEEWRAKKKGWVQSGRSRIPKSS